MTEHEEQLTERAQDILKDLLIKSFLPSDEIDVEEMQDEDKKMFRFNIVSDEPQTLIGRHGETLFALQQLLRLILKKEFKDHTSSVIVDVDNYRKEQEKSAIHVAKMAIRSLMRTGEAQKLFPMPSYKRRAIHAFLLNKEYENISSESEGRGEGRCVVLKLKSQAS